jgi:hypothetical protein
VKDACHLFNRLQHCVDAAASTYTLGASKSKAKMGNLCSSDSAAASGGHRADANDEKRHAGRSQQPAVLPE